MMTGYSFSTIAEFSEIHHSFEMIAYIFCIKLFILVENFNNGLLFSVYKTIVQVALNANRGLINAFGKLAVINYDMYKYQKGCCYFNKVTEIDPTSF